MKVIGKTDSGYICEVSHEEIEKHLNLYYGRLEKLKTGESISLGRGYDFASEIKLAFKETQNFVNANQKIIDAIMNGLKVISFMEKEEIK